MITPTTQTFSSSKLCAAASSSSLSEHKPGVLIVDSRYDCALIWPGTGDAEFNAITQYSAEKTSLEVSMVHARSQGLSRAVHSFIVLAGNVTSYSPAMSDSCEAP